MIKLKLKKKIGVDCNETEKMTRNIYDRISKLKSERQVLILAAEHDNDKIKILETRISETEERLEEAMETERGLRRQLRDTRKSLLEQEDESFKKELDLLRDLHETERQLTVELGGRKSESVITPSQVDTTGLEGRSRRKSRVKGLARGKRDNWAM